MYYVLISVTNSSRILEKKGDSSSFVILHGVHYLKSMSSTCACDDPHAFKESRSVIWFLLRQKGNCFEFSAKRGSEIIDLPSGNPAKAEPLWKSEIDLWSRANQSRISLLVKQTKRGPIIVSAQYTA